MISLCVKSKSDQFIEAHSRIAVISSCWGVDVGRNYRDVAQKIQEFLGEINSADLLNIVVTALIISIHYILEGPLKIRLYVFSLNSLGM